MATGEENNDTFQPKKQHTRPRLISKKGHIIYIQLPNASDDTALIPIRSGQKVRINLQNDILGGVIKNYYPKTSTIILKEAFNFATKRRYCIEQVLPLKNILNIQNLEDDFEIENEIPNENEKNLNESKRERLLKSIFAANTNETIKTNEINQIDAIKTNEIINNDVTRKDDAKVEEQKKSDTGSNMRSLERHSKLKNQANRKKTRQVRINENHQLNMSSSASNDESRKSIDSHDSEDYDQTKHKPKINKRQNATNINVKLEETSKIDENLILNSSSSELSFKSMDENNKSFGSNNSEENNNQTNKSEENDDVINIIIRKIKANNGIKKTLPLSVRSSMRSFQNNDDENKKNVDTSDIEVDNAAAISIKSKPFKENYNKLDTITETKANENSIMHENHQIENNNIEACEDFTGPSYEFDEIMAKQIKDLTQNCLEYLTQFDRNYYNAIEFIKTQKIISLSTEPDKCGHHARISLLTIGTRSKIYIFDIIFMGKILNDLKEILESKRLKKIIHFSPHIYDQLAKLHNIYLCGVFDTYAAFSMYAKPREQPLDLVEIVKKTMGVPNVYFTSGEDSYHEMNTYTRPLPQTIISIVAKKAAFQLQLYDYFLHECMLETFYNQCDNFAKKYSTCELTDAASKMSKDFGLFGMKIGNIFD